MSDQEGQKGADSDELSEAERAELHASIVRGIEDGEAGREMDAAAFLKLLASEP